MLVDKLECLNETESLIDGSSDGKVIDGDLAEDSVGVDDEETTVSDALQTDSLDL